MQKQRVSVHAVNAYVELELSLDPFLTWMEVRGQFHELGTLPSGKKLLASVPQTWPNWPRLMEAAAQKT